MSSGKWYYEVEILSPGSVSVGWAITDAAPDASLGGDESSWGYDGSLEEKINAGIRESYGKKWAVGDIVGVFLDTNDRTIGTVWIFTVSVDVENLVSCCSVLSEWRALG